MVDTTINTALRTLLGAQNASSQNSLSALKNNAQAKQAIVAPFQKSGNSKAPATTSAASLNMLSTGGNIAIADSLPSNLPRGSLINILV